MIQRLKISKITGRCFRCAGVTARLQAAAGKLTPDGVVPVLHLEVSHDFAAAEAVAAAAAAAPVTAPDAPQKAPASKAVPKKGADRVLAVGVFKGNICRCLVHSAMGRAIGTAMSCRQAYALPAQWSPQGAFWAKPMSSRQSVEPDAFHDRA